MHAVIQALSLAEDLSLMHVFIQQTYRAYSKRQALP